MSFEDDLKLAAHNYASSIPRLSLSRDQQATPPGDIEDIMASSQSLAIPRDTDKQVDRRYRVNYALTLFEKDSEYLKRFEEYIESARQELLLEVDADIAITKQKVADLREAFNAKMQTAVRVVYAHAGDQWVPEEGSLADVIWNFDPKSQSNLSLFRLGAWKQRMSQVLQIHVESVVPELAQFNISIDPSLGKVYERSQLEAHIRRNDTDLIEMKLRCDQLNAENATLQREIDNMREICAEFRQQMAALKDNAENCIKQLRIEKEIIRSNSINEANALKIEVNRLKEPTRREAERLQHEFTVLKSVYNEVDAFKDKGLAEKAAGLYQESAASLQKAWSCIEGKPAAWKQTAAVGVALSEVLGLHFGQFAEAEIVLDECTAMIHANGPDSEEVMKLRNVKAAIYFHSGRFTECGTCCIQTLQLFETAKVDAELYLTTLYYLVFALCAQRKAAHANSVWKLWVLRYADEEEPLAHFLKLCISGRIALDTQNFNYAGKLLHEAALFAANRFPTSIYTLTNLYCLSELYVKTNHLIDARFKLSYTNSLFALHFPYSVYSGRSLETIGEDQAQSTEIDRESREETEEDDSIRMVEARLDDRNNH